MLRHNGIRVKYKHSALHISALYKKTYHSPGLDTGNKSEVPVAAPHQALNLSSLRSAALPVFSNDGFRNVLWAGVFGSFSRGEQKESGDVDVVVVWDPAHKTGWQPRDDWFYLELQEELKKVWGREVDVIDIRRGRLAMFIDVEALLTSRTLYGSEMNEHVIKARRDALEVVDNGIVVFADACKKIRETRAMTEGKIFEDFTASDDLRQTVRDRLNGILDDLEVDPPTNPLSSRFFFTIICPARQLKYRLREKLSQSNSNEPNSEYWKAVWDAVTDTTPSVNNLKNFDQWTRVHVIAGGLENTKGLSAYVHRLDAEEDPTPRASASPLRGASYLYIRELVGKFFDHLTKGAARMF